MVERVVFGRIGWMTYYNGPQPTDKKPRGGGRYNVKKVGAEVYNFREIRGKVYGFFMMPVSAEEFDLTRIAPNCEGNEIDKTLVVLFAPSRDRGQVVVGWYRNATMFSYYQNRPHLPDRRSSYNCVARAQDAVLVPTNRRVQVIPRGKGTPGQSNVFYLLDRKGKPRKGAWIRRVLDYVESYDGPNSLDGPEAEAQAEVTAASEKTFAEHAGQGMGGTPSQRRAVEGRAMRAATSYFRKRGFRVDDVSDRRPYDLLCTKGSSQLHVEVKGTQGAGDKVFLTKNEVAHARSHPKNAALLVLHGVRVGGRKSSPSATGGKMVLVRPWRVKGSDLEPLAYSYLMPSRKGR